MALPLEPPLMEQQEEEEEEEVERMEEAYHHPSAPCSELFDMRTTVDPSYIISLIRKLLPHNTRIHHPEDDPNASVQHKITLIASRIPTPHVQRFPSNTLDVMDTTTQLTPQTEDTAISTADEAAWEENGCILWDLAVNKNHAVFMVENLLLEVLLASLTVSQSVRITEIGLGILANIACHDVLTNRMVSMPGLIDTILDQLFLDDSLCLSEAFWLLTLGLQGSGSATWAKALQSEHILLRILWVAENTLNSQLLEKVTGLLLAVVDSQREVSHVLLPSLMKLGLPDLLVSLFACEMKHLSGERVPDRYSVLDTILRVIEALSVLDDYSKLVSSNKELLQLIYDLVKLPDKAEISSSCVTAVVLIANILTDEPDLASQVSQDLPLFQSLLGLIPFVSNDLEARSALWSVLERVLIWVQEEVTNPSSLHQYVMVLVDKSDFIEEDSIDHHFEVCNKVHNSNTSLAKATASAASLSKIGSILQRWTETRENTRMKDADREDSVDGSVYKLLECCQKYSL